MGWAQRSIALGILWLAFAAVALATCTFGSAILGPFGVVPEGSLRHGFEFATTNLDYIAAGALSVASIHIYTGFARLRPTPEAQS